MADNVELSVRWLEAGADVPARTRAHLQGLRQAADEAAPSVGDRMQQAFARLEAREPTMVLRRARLAIEELGASALGVQGPLGRMAASLAMLIPGGTLTLGIVAGVAAIGAEIKHIVNFADELDKKLLKLGEGFAVGPAKAMFHAAGLEQQVTEMQSPGFFATIGNTVADMFSPTGWRAAESGAAIGRRTELAATQGAAGRAQQDVIDAIHAEHAKAEREEAKAVQDATFAVTKASLGFAPLKTNLFDIETGIKLTAIALSGMNPTQMQRVIGLTSEARALERANLLQTERNAAMVKAGFPSAIPMTPEALEAFLRGERADAFRGRGANFGVPSYTETGIIPPGMQAALLGQGGIFGNLGAAGADLPAILRGHQGEARQPGQKQDVDTLGLKIGTVIAGHMVGLASAMSRGDAGGVISSMGSAAGGVMSALGQVKGASASLGPAGALVSAGASAIGGLVSLFGSHRPKIIISAFEEQALQEIRNLRADPLTTSFTVIGPADLRSMQYGLSRLQRRDSVTRLP